MADLGTLTVSIASGLSYLGWTTKELYRLSKENKAFRKEEEEDEIRLDSALKRARDAEDATAKVNSEMLSLQGENKALREQVARLEHRLGRDNRPGGRHDRTDSISE